MAKTIDNESSDKANVGLARFNTPESLYSALREEAGEQTLPPVHLWNPERRGTIDIHIKRDGRWFHDGGEIKRIGLVKVLASVMRRDEDGFVLVTPAERLLITVDDAPFIAGGMEVQNAGTPEQELMFTTNIGELVVASAKHPIAVTYENPRDPEEPRPYVEVRKGLHALIARSVFYRLVELGREQDGRFVVTSAGVDFELGTL